jgi:DNA-binding CsgD family transcriptional regulator
MDEKGARVKALSQREREVLKWMAEGKTNREIGMILGIATGTVRKHADNIFEKLGVSSRLAASLHRDGE